MGGFDAGVPEEEESTEQSSDSDLPEGWPPLRRINDGKVCLLRFRVWGLGLGVWGLGFGFWGFGV